MQRPDQFVQGRDRGDGHYKALSRCRLVGKCVRPGENFFPLAYDRVCTLDTVTGNLAVNSVFITRSDQ